MSKTKRTDPLDPWAVVHPNAAGLDTGAREIWACVPPGRDVEPVKRFNTFTPDWQALADWVVACGVDTVAMESTGVYWVAVEGISASRAQTVPSAIGTDMTKWENDKHFGSRLGVAPHHAIPGGKVLRSRTVKTHHRAGPAFRQAAASVTRSQSALGAVHRRKKAQLGPMQALVATAYKIARTVYYILKHRVQFHDIGEEAYEQKQREREIAHLKKKAAKLGFDISPHNPAAAVAQAVAKV